MHGSNAQHKATCRRQQKGGNRGWEHGHVCKRDGDGAVGGNCQGNSQATADQVLEASGTTAQIMVRTFEGMVIMVETACGDTCAHVKERIEDKTGVPVGEFKQREEQQSQQQLHLL